MTRNTHPRGPKVLHWDDERKGGSLFGGGKIVVTTSYGFAFEPHEDWRTAEHVRGFDTVKEAQQALRHRVRPCTCWRCESCGAEPRLGED